MTALSVSVFLFLFYIYMPKLTFKDMSSPKVCLHIQELQDFNSHYHLRVNHCILRAHIFLTNSGFLEVARLHFTCTSLEVNEQLNRYGLHLIIKPIYKPGSFEGQHGHKEAQVSQFSHQQTLPWDRLTPIPSPHSWKRSRLSFHAPQT